MAFRIRRNIKVFFYLFLSFYFFILSSLVFYFGYQFYTQSSIAWTIVSEIIPDDLQEKLSENYTVPVDPLNPGDSSVYTEKIVTYFDPLFDDFEKEYFTSLYDLQYQPLQSGLVFPPIFPKDDSEKAYDLLKPGYYKGMVTVLGFEGYGSGYVFGETSTGEILVMTNAHVLEQDSTTFAVLTYEGELLKAKTFDVDRGRDLGVLEVVSNKLRPLDFANTPPESGSVAIVVGSPKDQVNVVSVGEVTDLNFNALLMSENNQAMQLMISLIDAVVRQGDSGGPVFNDQGEVIGTTCCVFNPASNGDTTGGFVGYERTLYRISDYLENGKFTKYDLGIDEIEVVRRNTIPGLTKNGYKILTLNADSIAAENGLKVGDIIVEINNRNIYTNNENALFHLQVIEDLIGGNESITFDYYSVDEFDNLSELKRFEVNLP